MIEKRLFVALELPDAVTAVLAAIRPPLLEGIRWVEPEEMHLTLHFRGSADITDVVNALRAVSMPRCELAITGVGRFTPDGDFPLWARVAESAELTRLHQRVGSALAKPMRRGPRRLDALGFRLPLRRAILLLPLPHSCITRLCAR